MPCSAPDTQEAILRVRRCLAQVVHQYDELGRLQAAGLSTTTAEQELEDLKFELLHANAELKMFIAGGPGRRSPAVIPRL